MLQRTPACGSSFSAMTRRDCAGGMAVELEDDTLFVIHAMPLRDRYRKQYEEAKNGEGK